LRETAAAFTNWGRFPTTVAINTASSTPTQVYDPTTMLRLIGRAWDGIAHLAWYLHYRVEGDQRSRTSEH
jgi:hypothetical protein